jgi:transcriptional regulator with XRE-family HTH domain
MLAPKKSEPCADASCVGVPPGPRSRKLGERVVEEYLSEKRIGGRIKKLRLKKSMSLAELASHTGLSVSFLSQLETGRVIPTLRNLTRIAMVFSKDLNYFFEPEPKTLFQVHRRIERLRLPETGAANPTYSFESLGYMVPERQLDPYFAEFFPRKTGHRSHQHEGCEFLFVTSGQLELRHGSSTARLEAGDAVYFDGTTAHSYVCCGEEPATALIATFCLPQGEPRSQPRPGENLLGNTTRNNIKEPRRFF